MLLVAFTIALINNTSVLLNLSGDRSAEEESRKGDDITHAVNDDRRCVAPKHQSEENRNGNKYTFSPYVVQRCISSSARTS